MCTIKGNSLLITSLLKKPGAANFAFWAILPGVPALPSFEGKQKIIIVQNIIKNAWPVGFADL